MVISLPISVKSMKRKTKVPQENLDKEREMKDLEENVAVPVPCVI